MGDGMASNIQTLDDFLDTINNAGGANYHDVNHLMTLFCNDHGNYPFVGITQRGPQFKHRAKIEKLFDRLLTKSFPDMAWTPANTLRMTDGDTVAVEVDVTGTQKAEWFQDDFKSHPLSQIDEITIANLPSNNKMDIPACMVFTFDGQYKIQQLAIYMDRYKMMDDLSPKQWRKIFLPEQKHPIVGARVTEYGPAHGKRITIIIDE
jgi:SnoaL-like domain